MQESRPRRVYFDSCVFISHLQDGEDRPNEEEKRVLASVGSEVRKGRIHIVLSTIVYTEVIRKSDRSGMAEFGRYIETSPETSEVEPSARICTKAGEIRLQYEVEGNDGQARTMGTPDAIHLATAILWEVGAFFTYEGRLLRLDGRIDGLKIEKPNVPQMELDV